MTPAEESVRLFVAVPMAEGLRDRALALQKRLAEDCRGGPRIKWVERPNLHMTLAFIGDTPPGDVDGVREIARRAASDARATSLELRGVGCFPPRGAPRTIWVGAAEESPELTALAERLDEELSGAGLAEPARHPLTVHFTLGRVKGRGDRRTREAIEGLGEEPVGGMDVTEFVLMSSDLTPRGPVYAERDSFELGH